MRIVSGKYKGKRITAPKRLPVRPTTDMAKEALFNILNNSYYFDDITVLDLFAGTGNISYEFASRGTDEITCVDADRGCLKFIDRISEELNFNITTVKSDVYKYLERSVSRYNIIFADPPYDFSLEKFSRIPKLVFKNNLLVKNGILIIEHSKHLDLSGQEHLKDQRKYGGSVFSFFEG